MGIRDPYTNTHTYCYQNHMGPLNLIVVHYITDCYQKKKKRKKKEKKEKENSTQGTNVP